MKSTQENNQLNFFNKKENQYDFELIKNPPLHVKEEINLLLNKIKKIKIKNIIEFGSGTGRLTIPLLKNNYKVNAIDISKNSLLRLKNVASNLNLNKNLSIARCIDTSCSAEIIVGSDILHHILLQKYLPIFYDKLKSRGMIIFSEPNCFNIYWLIYISLFAKWQAEKGIFQCNYFNLKKRLINAKFKNIRIEGFGLFPSALLNWSKTLLKLNLFLGNLPILKYFSVRLIISAEK